jgi:hypothetical protein
MRSSSPAAAAQARKTAAAPAVNQPSPARSSAKAPPLLRAGHRAGLGAMPLPINSWKPKARVLAVARAPDLAHCGAAPVHAAQQAVPGPSAQPARPQEQSSPGDGAYMRSPALAARPRLTERPSLKPAGVAVRRSASAWRSGQARLHLDPALVPDPVPAATPVESLAFDAHSPQAAQAAEPVRVAPQTSRFFDERPKSTAPRRRVVGLSRPARPAPAPAPAASRSDDALDLLESALQPDFEQVVPMAVTEFALPENPRIFGRDALAPSSDDSFDVFQDLEAEHSAPTFSPSPARFDFGGDVAAVPQHARFAFPSSPSYDLPSAAPSRQGLQFESGQPFAYDSEGAAPASPPPRAPFQLPASTRLQRFAFRSDPVGEPLGESHPPYM